MRAIGKRISAVEAKVLPAEIERPWHQIIAESDAGAQSAIAALVQAGSASPEDNFIVWMIVDPKLTTEGRVICAPSR